jgi:hypothetical protein
VAEGKKSRVAMRVLRGRDGVVTLAAPGVAAADAAKAEPGAA